MSREKDNILCRLGGCGPWIRKSDPRKLRRRTPAQKHSPHLINKTRFQVSFLDNIAHHDSIAMEARCECGAVTFTTPLAAPLKLYICHCTDCRHQTSSAFGISAMFPYFALPASNGNVHRFMKRTSRRAAVECFFCGQCGSRLVHGGVAQKYVSVKGGCLEGLSLEMLQGAVHIWTKSAVTATPPGVTQYLEDPPEEPGQEL